MDELDAFRRGIVAPDAKRIDNLRALVQARALEKDPRGVIEALYHGYFLDGLYRRILSKWGALSKDEVYDAIANAITVFFEKTSRGEQVRNPLAYIHKVATGYAYDKYKENALQVELDPEMADFNDANIVSHIDRDAAIREALKIARSLIKDLGQENVRLVM